MSAVANVAINVDSRGAVGKLKQIADRGKEVDRSLNGAANASARAANTISKTGNSAVGAAVKLKSFGAALNSALGPIGLALSGLAGLGAAFQTLQQQDFAEAKFRSLGGDSKVLVDELKKVSKELNGQASVVELTAAAYDVASAGFSKAADAAKVLKAASLGATGGFSDINTVGNAATSVLNAYGLSADKASGLIDRFIQTQNDGKIVVAEYAANIGKVASAAAGLGIPLEEVNAVIAQATASGVQADVAFTGLKSAFARLASGDANKELEAFGISIDAASLKSNGLIGTFKKLKNAGLDTGAIFKVLGTEAGPALLPVLNNLEKFEKLLENQKNSAGAAAKAQTEAANTIQGSWKRLTTAIQNLFSDQAELRVAIRETIKAAAVTVELLVEAFQAVGNVVRALVNQTQQAGTKISATWKAVGDFFAKIGQFMSQQWQFRLGEILKNAAGGNAALQGIFESIGNAWAKTVDFMGQYFEKFVEYAINGMVGVLTGPMQTAFRAAGINIGEAVATGIGSFGGGGSAPKPSADSGYSGLTLPAGLDSSSGDGSAASGGKGKGNKAADELKKQQEAGAALLTQQERQIQLKLLESNLEKELLQIDFNRLDALKQIENIAPGQRGEATAQANTLAQMQAGEAIGEALAEQILKEQALQQIREDALRPLEQQRELLEAKLNGTEKEVRLRQHNDEIMRQTQGLERASVEELIRGNNVLQEQLDKQSELNNLYASMGSAVANTFSQAFDAAVDGTENLGEALQGLAADLLKTIGKMLIMYAIAQALGAAAGGAGGDPNSFMGFLAQGFGFKFGARANGGPVSPNSTYLVGERGPELLTMGSNGGYVHNNQSAAMDRYRNGGGAGAQAVNVSYSVTEINGMRFVTEDQFRAGMDQAAQRGAKMGQSRTIGTLKNSRAQRSKLGL